MTTMNTLSPLQGLGSRIENAYRKHKWTKIKKARPDIIFDKETEWWAYVQPQAYPRVTGHGTTLQAALQSLLDQLEMGPQQWMISSTAAKIQQAMIANQATDRNPGMTRKPDLSVYTFAQESSSNSSSPSSLPIPVPSTLPHNPTLIAPPAELGPFLQSVQQFCNAIVRDTIPQVTNPVHRPMSTSPALTAPVKHRQQVLGMTPNHMGPWPSRFKNSTGVVSPAIPNDSVVPVAMTNPAVSRPFLQGALVPSSFDQTSSHQVDQPTAPICEAPQIKQNFSSLLTHDTSVDVPQVDQTKQGDAMRGGSRPTLNSGTVERVQKQMQVEEYLQNTRAEQQSKAIKLEDQPQRNEIEEQPQEIKLEERPSKKIKLEDLD